LNFCVSPAFKKRTAILIDKDWFTIA